MRIFLIIGCILGWAWLARAKADYRNCAVCNVDLTNRFHLISSPAFNDPQPVCQECTTIRERCAECNLPVRGRHLNLKDGRLLCVRHAGEAVFEERTGQDIFNDVKRDVMGMFAGSGILPDHNITVSMLDRKRLTELIKDHPQLHGDSTLGLTHTSVAADGKQQHEIFLLNGLTKPHLMAVCAHEYAHTWVNENVKRKIEAGTVEAFCELAAYKLMHEYRQEGQKRAIMANTYTDGRIEVMVKMESSYRFYDVLQWMKTGVDAALSNDDAARLLAVKNPTTSPAFGFRPAARTPVPDKLTLKGISGTANRRFALVNDCTVQKDELAKVRVGTTNVAVRCLEISEQSVRLQMVGTGETLELFLRVE